MKSLFLVLVCSLGTGDVTVSGTGSVPVTPDIAVVQFRIATNNKDVKNAISANAKEMALHHKTLRDTYKIDEADLCTHGFNIEPQYESNKDGSMNMNKITGYNVFNSLIVTIKDTSKAGEIVGAISTSNAIRIDNINFVVSDTLRNSVLDKARKLAIEDAMNRADVYCKAAGTSRGPVKSINEQGSYVPRYDTGRSVNAASVVVPLAAGTSKVSVNVLVVFECMSEQKKVKRIRMP